MNEQQIEVSVKRTVSFNGGLCGEECPAEPSEYTAWVFHCPIFFSDLKNVGQQSDKLGVIRCQKCVTAVEAELQRQSFAKGNVKIHQAEAESGDRRTITICNPIKVIRIGDTEEERESRNNR